MALLPQPFLDFYNRSQLARFKSLWDLEDWLAYFDERAAIAEYDGEMSHSNAEAQAYEACVNEWRKQKKTA